MSQCHSTTDLDQHLHCAQCRWIQADKRVVRKGYSHFITRIATDHAATGCVQRSRARLWQTRRPVRRLAKSNSWQVLGLEGVSQYEQQHNCFTKLYLGSINVLFLIYYWEGPFIIGLLFFYKTVPAAEAILGHKSADSLPTGPVMAEPFISPLGLTITPALSIEKYQSDNFVPKANE